MDRRELIRNRLCEHLLEDRGCAVVCPPKEVVLQTPITGHLFGWLPPMPIDEDNNLLLLVAFCPELLAEITAGLDDNDLDFYLSAIEELWDCYLEEFEAGSTLSPDDMRVKVESDFFDKEPEILAFMSQVEMQALSDGIVPTRIP